LRFHAKCPAQTITNDMAVGISRILLCGADGIGWG